MVPTITRYSPQTFAALMMARRSVSPGSISDELEPLPEREPLALALREASGEKAPDLQLGIERVRPPRPVERCVLVVALEEDDASVRRDER